MKGKSQMKMTLEIICCLEEVWPAPPVQYLGKCSPPLSGLVIRKSGNVLWKQFQAGLALKSGRQLLYWLQDAAMRAGGVRSSEPGQGEEMEEEEKEEEEEVEEENVKKEGEEEFGKYVIEEGAGQVEVGINCSGSVERECRAAL
ncbi:unnamed protein product [Protopolystoma xenopodis]|uniref:Uncharacterized protein n=1 Tax=Protopolystoma xenopodis TaxID=117903 RepID=A0A3S5A920_9PLAT|nr:unnamed protein product [Protopolystoma xenopodis]